MATITEPMALDKTFNTTETTPRSQADVLAAIESAIRQGFGRSAADVSYDNTTSELTADDVQEAIDELADEKVDKVAGKGLSTNDYTDEDKEALDNMEFDIAGTQTVSGNPITLNDAAPINAESLVVELEPKQDLHGQSAPYVGGAGKNKIDTSADSDFYIGHYYISANGSMEANNNFDAFRCELNSDTTYTLSNNLGTDLSGSGGIIRFENADKSLNSVNVSGFSQTSATFELPTNAVYIVVCVNNTVGVMLQLEVGSQATTFAPYSNICPITGYTECEVDDVGANQWDEEYQQGYWTSSGYFQTANNQLCTKNKVKVTPGATYYFKINHNTSLELVVCCYDENGDFIERRESEPYEGDGIEWSIPNDTYYIHVNFTEGYGATYNHDISINYPSTDKNYHPYHSSNATIQFGQTVYGGSVDFLTGELTVTYREVDLGSLNWNYENSISQFYAGLTGIITDGYNNTIKAPMVCTNYPTYAYYNNGFFEGHEIGIAFGFESGNLLYVKDSTYSDAATFKTAMQGAKLVYELAEPITYQLTPTDLKLLQDTNNITTNGTTINLGYQPDNVIGEVKGEIEKCSPNPEFMHFEVNGNVVDAVPIIFDEAIHSYTVSGDNWKDKTFLCVECCDMRYGILQLVLSSDMAFVDSCGKALLLYPYIRSVEQYIKITISLGQSYGYEISYQTTNTQSLLDYLKIRVRLFN